jgi:hypothetical protein
MGASAIAATVCDPKLFRSGRDFAAWLGMTPRQNSSGAKERLASETTPLIRKSCIQRERSPFGFTRSPL